MTEQSIIRVMTVDDHEIMRGGIRFVLLAFDDLKLVAEARSGQEALQLCGETQPDVILMDMKMPNMDGVATTQAIKNTFPDVQIVALTSYYESDLVQRVMQAGAVGYVLKDTSKDDLADAIRTARSGRTYLAPEAANALLDAPSKGQCLGADLTSRERRILALLTKGLSNTQIGVKLERSPFTVRHHVSRIIAKLGAANRAEAAALAVQHGLVGDKGR